ncbi:MAG: T9SS type A sorting domain-containing protein [Saprospiraceae bacterium]|nr:T9SS type A sorting domain-containing protein [Saprospiraceae bacterium]
MSKKLILSILLCLLTWHVKIIAQPFKPYQSMVLEDVTPYWYYTSIDSTSIGSEKDGYNRLEGLIFLSHLLHGENLYIIYRNISGGNGYLVEKRSLNDGKLIWQINYPKKLLGRDELARLMYINSKNRLVVVSERAGENSAGQFFISHNNSRLCQREFDNETGQLLMSYLADNDTDAVTLAHGAFLQGYYFSYFYYENENRYRYIQIDKKSNPSVIKSILLNELGHSIGPPHILETSFDIFNVMKTEDHFIILDKKENENSFKAKFYDFNLNEIKTIEIPVDISIGLYSIKFFDGQNFIVYNIPNNIDSSEYCVINLNEGYKLKTIFQDSCNEGPVVKFFENKMHIISSCRNQNAPFKLNFRKYDDTGMIMHETNYTLQDSLKGPFAYDFEILDTNKLLVFFHEQAYIKFGDDIVADQEGKAKSVMLLDSNPFKISTSTEIPPALADIQIFPNPTSQFFTLKMSELNFSNPLQFAVYSIEGKLIDTIHIYDGSNITFGENYTSGYYVVEIKMGAILIQKQIVKL